MKIILIAIPLIFSLSIKENYYNGYIYEIGIDDEYYKGAITIYSQNKASKYSDIFTYANGRFSLRKNFSFLLIDHRFNKKIDSVLFPKKFRFYLYNKPIKLSENKNENLYYLQMSREKFYGVEFSQLKENIESLYNQNQHIGFGHDITMEIADTSRNIIIYTRDK